MTQQNGKIAFSHRLLVFLVLLLVQIFIGRLSGEAVAANHNVRVRSQDSFDIYKNREYQFEIKFPSSWAVTEEREQGVGVAAVNGKGSSINVTVSPYLGHDPTKRELLAMLEAGAMATKREYPGAVIVAKGLRYLSGKKGLYQKFRVVYSAQGYSVTNITANYTVFMNRRVYTITASAPLNSYEEIEPLLNASISSFAVRGYSRR